MKYKVIFSENAKRDLESISKYIDYESLSQGLVKKQSN